LNVVASRVEAGQVLVDVPVQRGGKP
jgi:hypothetical protein